MEAVYIEGAVNIALNCSCYHNHVMAKTALMEFGLPASMLNDVMQMVFSNGRIDCCTGLGHVGSAFGTTIITPAFSRHEAEINILPRQGNIVTTAAAADGHREISNVMRHQ